MILSSTASASPETLVKLEGEKLYTFPLAGTRRRGKDSVEDMQLEAELLQDEKELAEHNMLVDLGRNDLGKISEIGSVKVERYMEIHRFSHVMHIGSTVSGIIRKDKDGLDAVEAVLPAGTLSGAPKIRACEIIHKLENHKRGIYGGAIGYLSFTGDMDTCIAIRLAFSKNGKVYVRAGAGIVGDSIPEKEYRECIPTDWRYYLRGKGNPQRRDDGGGSGTREAKSNRTFAGAGETGGGWHMLRRGEAAFRHGIIRWLPQRIRYLTACA